MLRYYQCRFPLLQDCVAAFDQSHWHAAHHWIALGRDVDSITQSDSELVMGNPSTCVGICIFAIPRLFEFSRYGILFHWCAKQCHDFVFICLGAGSPRAFGRWTRRFIGGDHQSSSWEICGKTTWIFPRTYLLAFFRFFVGVFVSLSIFFTINHVFLYNQNSNAFLWTQR